MYVVYRRILILFKHRKDNNKIFKTSLSFLQVHNKLVGKSKENETHDFTSLRKAGGGGSGGGGGWSKRDSGRVRGLDLVTSDK